MSFPAAALLALTVLRLVVAACVPLSPDEAYYWIWSRNLAGGYFDHPPMVALWIRVGTFLCGDTPLGVRVLAPLSVALGSVLLARAGAVFTGSQAQGVMAAALLNATLAFGVGAVTMTPDTPLLFFWVCALAALARFLASGRGAWLLAVGAGTGLALASKYTAIFLGASVAIWFLAVPALRPWLRTLWPWASGALALLIFAPVITWNAAHHWAGFAKQGGRIGGFRPGQALTYLAELIGGQIGMLTPLVFLLCCVGVWVAARRAWLGRDPALVLLVLLTLLPLPIFFQHVIADRVQANWPAIVYPSAVLLGAMVWARLHRPALALGFALTAPVYLQAAWPVLPIPAKLDPSMKRLAGWADFARDVEAARLAQGAQYIVADNYPIAAMLAWHAKTDVPIVAAQARWALFDLPRPDLTGQTGLLVRSARSAENFEARPWPGLSNAGTAQRTRDGVTAEVFRLYRVTGQSIDPRFVTLPRPAARRTP